ncbi:hypothetical protein AAF712_011526 [Marasmius tenuissimus]|uniref:Amidohydrolase-related domain-containing protein n=1 Tax=Marasmius tenuissimus TaxID=585030 RepID=A0ABR2ZK82_9AGAR
MSPEKGGIELLSTHLAEGPIFPSSNLPETIQRWDLIGTNKPNKFRFLLAHGTGISQDQAEFFVKNDMYVVSAPTTELQLGHGRPVCYDDNIRAKSCLGGDMSSNGMRNQKIIDDGGGIRSVHRTVEQAYNLGTIQGARAVGMEDKIGSIEVGKLADLVVFDGGSPAMVCAAQNNPVTAVVLFSTPGDIELVIIDGVVRKSEGKLCSARVETGEIDIAGKETLEWADIRHSLLEKRVHYWDRLQGADFEAATKVLYLAKIGHFCRRGFRALLLPK